MSDQSHDLIRELLAASASTPPEQAAGTTEVAASAVADCFGTNTDTVLEALDQLPTGGTLEERAAALHAALAVKS